MNAPTPDCRNDPTEVTFDDSPGGTPETTPTFVYAHACALQIVDVREAEELHGSLGAIAGARHVPQRRVAIEAQAWDRDAPIVLVCRSGRRSGAVARELEALGFSHVASMTGGMLGWRAQGLPTVDGAALVRPEPEAETAAVRHTVTRDEVAGHVGDRDRVRWTKAATLMLHGTQACVDGRDAHAIVGTPGGDAGELVLALTVAEQRAGRPLSREEIERIFDAYLEAFGHFYLHTDEHAVAALVDRIAKEIPDAPLPAAHDRDAAARILLAPPPSLRARVSALLSEPALVGCGHLRLMLEHPEQYGVRRDLVADVLRVVHERRWDGERRIDLVVLQGGHAESAVVTVQLPHEVHAFTRIPLVSPRIGDREVFVTHPQVARFVRRENAAFLLEQVPRLRADDDEPGFLDDLEALATRQREATIGHLAPGLPQYRVQFLATGPAETFEVVGPLAPTQGELP